MKHVVDSGDITGYMSCVLAVQLLLYLQKNMNGKNTLQNVLYLSVCPPPFI